MIRDANTLTRRLIAAAAVVIAAAGLIFWPRPSHEPPQAGSENPRELAGTGEPPATPLPLPERERGAGAGEAPAAPAPRAYSREISALVDSKRRVSERVTSDISSRRPRAAHPDDLAALVYCLTDPSDHDTVRNEVANLLGRSKYPGLADALIKVLDNPAEKARFRAFAAQHLGGLVAPASPPVVNGAPTGAEAGATIARAGATIQARLRAALDDRHTPVQREALLALVRARDPLGIETAERWFVSPARGKLEDEGLDLAIRLMHDLDRREHIPKMRLYTKDGNEPVRIAAIVALSQWGDEESRSAFEAAASSENARTQRAGKAALVRLDQIAKK